MPTLVREPESLITLPPRLNRPSSLGDGRWAVARLDTPGRFDLGPSMLEVVLWYPIDDGAGSLGVPHTTWADVEAALGPPGATAAVTINRLAVDALIGGRVEEMQVTGDDVAVTGPTYVADAFAGNGFFGSRAVRIPGGLLVAVRTGG